MARKVQITETVLRDANQSLMATRLPYADYEDILETMDKAGYYSVECWGGATFDSCLRYLGEDPSVVPPEFGQGPHLSRHRHAGIRANGGRVRRNLLGENPVRLRRSGTASLWPAWRLAATASSLNARTGVTSSRHCVCGMKCLNGL